MESLSPAAGPLTTCPYTGDELKVIETEHGLMVQGGFNPAGWCDDPDKLIRLLRQRRGLPDAHKGDLVCPYRGNPVQIVKSDVHGVFRAQGAWTPHGKLWTWRSELLYDISYRNGVAPAFEREHTVIKTADREAPQSSDPSENWGSGKKGSEIADRVVDLVTSSV